MNELFIALLSIFGLLAGTLSMFELGRWMGRRRLKRFGQEAITSVGTVDGAIFALLGLLLAFTFSGASSRFDARRQMVVEEANDIGTAYLRIDLLPADAQPALRESFRQYVDSRLVAYRKLSDITAAKVEMASTGRLQQEIWTQAVAACHVANSPSTTTLVLPAINQMIDITTTRAIAAETHPPAVVFAMLLTLVLASSFLAGHGTAAAEGRDWIHTLCFAIVMSAAVYVILDFEFPRLGLIRIDSFDHVLVDVRKSMN